MRPRKEQLRVIHNLFLFGLDSVEYLGLLAIAFATTFAFFLELSKIFHERNVVLADLLLMFLYLEVLAMVGVYLKTGQLPVRFPLYIAVVAIARHIIVAQQDMSAVELLASAGGIVMLTLAVLAVRYGHVRFPYTDDDVSNPKV